MADIPEDIMKVVRDELDFDNFAYEDEADYDAAYRGVAGLILAERQRCAETISALTSERDALRRQLAEAVEALEPFVILSQAYPVSAWLDNDAAELTYPDCPSVGDLRRARDITRRIKT